MPEGVEYLHCVQMALDHGGLRYQVLDIEGRVREKLSWPISPTRDELVKLLDGENRVPFHFPRDDECIELRFSGRAAAPSVSCSQTLLSAHRVAEMPPIWIGLRGEEQRLTVIVHNEPRRSPHYWFGPKIEADRPFDIHLMLHAGMGPGGIMFKLAADHHWSSMSATSAWGLERLRPSEKWNIGHADGGRADRPFKGVGLSAFAAGQDP